MSEKRATVRQKRVIVERAAHCCEYCLSPADYTNVPFAVEHIVPLHRRGKTTLDNPAYSCMGCNGHKQTKIEALDPWSDTIVPLYHPRKHMWQEHFSWNDDATLILGLTSIGRATIEALQLNRIEVVNLRRVLGMAGEDPPPEPDQSKSRARG